MSNNSVYPAVMALYKYNYKENFGGTTKHERIN